MAASETWLLPETPFLGRPGSRLAVVCGWSGRRIIDGQNGGLILPTEPVTAHVLEWITRRCTYRARSSSSACGSSTRLEGAVALSVRRGPQTRTGVRTVWGAQEAMGDTSGVGVRDGVVRVSLGLVTSSSASTSTDLGMVRRVDGDMYESRESDTSFVWEGARCQRGESIWDRPGEVEVWSEGRMKREERCEITTGDNAGQSMATHLAKPCRFAQQDLLSV